jgi:hypothetical protein
MSQFGWGLVVRVLQEEKPKGNWYYLKNAYLGYMYTTDPFTRVMIDSARISSRGVGGPSDSPISTNSPVAASKRPSESRKAVKAQSAHGFRKTKGVSARGKCPKGHYWSYKEKKCVKSKFR